MQISRREQAADTGVQGRAASGPKHQTRPKDMQVDCCATSFQKARVSTENAKVYCRAGVGLVCALRCPPTYCEQVVNVHMLEAQSTRLQAQ